MKLVIEDEAGTRTVVPFTAGEITVGRTADSGGLRLTERDVSRRHARFIHLNGVIYVEDLGSLTWTRVNGDRISGRRRLREGDLIEIAGYDLAVVPDEGLAAVSGPGVPPPLPGSASPPAAVPRVPPSTSAESPTPAPPAVHADPAPAPRTFALQRPVALVLACVAALATGVVAGWVVGWGAP